MEARGAVNQYKCLGQKPRYTINLACGTTPMVVRFPKNGHDYKSSLYTLGLDTTEIVVEWCWYRPSAEEFLQIESMPVRQHILMGGLLLGKFGEAENLMHDLVVLNMTKNKLDRFLHTMYGD